MRKNKQPIQEISSEGYRGALGNFICLTDKYCLFPHNLSQKVMISLQSIFAFKKDFAFVPCSINDISSIGIMVAANNNGLVLPYTTSDSELQHITNCMPNDVRVYRLDEKLTGLTCLGNLILANDTLGLAAPQLSQLARDKIKEILKLEELYVGNIPRYSLVGTYFALNNYGILVPKDLTEEETRSVLLMLNNSNNNNDIDNNNNNNIDLTNTPSSNQLRLAQGSCADGKNELGREFCVNSTHLLCDGQTYQLEIMVAKQVLAVKHAYINRSTLRVPNSIDNNNNNNSNDNGDNNEIYGGEFQVMEQALLDTIL